MARFVDAHLLAEAYLDEAREEHLTGMVFLSPEDVANTILKLSEKLQNVEPVIHAHWIKTYNHIKCSSCGVVFFNQPSDKFKNYCSNCGAKMDGG